MIVQDIPRPTSQNPYDLGFGSPISAPSSPIGQSQDEFEPHYHQDEFPDVDDEGGSTPPSQERLLGAPRYPPPAPSKSISQGSIGSRRAHCNSAVRSLTPIFNGFAPAATRAHQMGGRFATLRPPAMAIAKMQRQMSQGALGETPAATRDTLTQPYGVNSSRKRSRDGAADGDSSPSIRTVSRGKEPRMMGTGMNNNGHGGDSKPF